MLKDAGLSSEEVQVSINLMNFSEWRGLAFSLVRRDRCLVFMRWNSLKVQAGAVACLEILLCNRARFDKHSLDGIEKYIFDQ
jgi:hypothetical protein